MIADPEVEPLGSKLFKVTAAVGGPGPCDGWAGTNHLILVRKKDDVVGSVDADGWPTAANDPASWEATLVAEGDTGSGDDHGVSHPWVMLTRTGVGEPRVQLLVQSQWREQSGTHDVILQIPSVNDVGDDFDLDCTTSCSVHLIAEGYVAVDADSTSATVYIEDARHGRAFWNYIADGYIRTETDLVPMFFTADRPTTGSCASSGADDIVKALGEWEDGEWVWQVMSDGGSPNCPAEQVSNAHDPTLIALPNNEYKMYYRDSLDGEKYSSGCVEAEFAPAGAERVGTVGG